jgi:hypothetical protein
MPDPDIFLKDDRITVVGSGIGDVAAFEVSTGEDSDADIRLNPDWANITAGGGDGDGEGDLVLLDREANPRIQLTAERGNKWDPEDENRVWVNGEDGIVKLAANSTQWEEQDIKIDATTANIELGGGKRDEDDDHGVSEGDVHLLDRDAKTRVQMTAERGNRADDDDNRVWINGEKGLIKLASVNTRWENQDIKLDSANATIEIGGGRRPEDDSDAPNWRGTSEGSVEISDGDGEVRVELDGASGDVIVSTDEGDEVGQVGFSDQPAAQSVKYFGSVTEGRLCLGGSGVDGTLEIDGPIDDTRIRIGGYRTGDDLSATVDDPNTRVRLKPEGSVELGGDGEGGSLSLTDGQGTETVQGSGEYGQIDLGTDGQGGTNGHLRVRGEYEGGGALIEGDSLGLGSKTDEYRNERKIQLDGSESSITVSDDWDNERIEAEATTASITLSARTQDQSDTYDSISLDGSGGEIRLSDETGDTVVIDGENGDIQVGSIQSLVSTIEDLENRVNTLESN